MKSRVFRLMIVFLGFAAVPHAGPRGSVVWTGAVGPGLGTYFYEIRDPDLVGRWDVFAVGAGRELGADAGCITPVPFAIAGAHIADHTHSIVWVDCQTRNGAQRNHTHGWRVPYNAGPFPERDPNALEMNLEPAGPAPSVFGMALVLPDAPGSFIVAVTASGLTPFAMHRALSHDTLSVACSGGGPTTQIGEDFMADEYGDGSIITVVSGSMDNVKGISVHEVSNDPAILRACGDGLVHPTGVGPTVSRSILRQNHPNPFGSATTITVDLSVDDWVDLSIYNVQGQLVRVLHRGHLSSGPWSVHWDGKDGAGNLASSGVYFYRLLSRNDAQVRKLVLMR